MQAYQTHVIEMNLTIAYNFQMVMVALIQVQQIYAAPGVEVDHFAEAAIINVYIPYGQVSTIHATGLNLIAKQLIIIATMLLLL